MLSRATIRRFSTERPIVHSVIHDSYVKKGHEKKVGLWLFGLSASIFSIVLLGGYTRLSKSGLSMTSWKLQGSRLPPTTEAWQEEFERYKKFPEY